MTRLLIAALALALTVGAADAAHKSKHKTVRHYGYHAAVAPFMVADPYAAYYQPGPRPPWAAPWQCFTDEGYGRYRPCDAGPSTPSR